MLSINGFTTSQLDANLGGGYATQLDGRPATLVVTEGTVQLAPITIVEGTYSLTSVWHAELVAPTIGYLHVKQFIATTKTEIRDTFARPGWGAVTDLIVDLRYNGGGSVLESARMSSHILGAPLAGKRFAFLQFNASKSAHDVSIPLGDTESGVSLLRATPIRRVAVIVSSRTCSASEEALAAIRSAIPAADFFIVGRTETCGKPFGFLPALFQIRVGIDDPNDPVVSAINFSSIAADGTTDYIKGFAPRCVISDDLSKPLIDPLEAQRQGARVAVETGACPVGTTATDRPHPLAEERPRLPDPLPSGLKRQHGSW